MSMIKQCGCGRSFTEETWRALDYCGRMDLGEEDEPALELRNCPCGSTLAIREERAERNPRSETPAAEVETRSSSKRWSLSP